MLQCGDFVNKVSIGSGEIFPLIVLFDNICIAKIVLDHSQIFLSYQRVYEMTMIVIYKINPNMEGPLLEQNFQT